MISLLKFLDGPWEQVRGYLREDLDHLEAAINQRWGQTFGDANKLDVSSKVSGVIAVENGGTGDATLPAHGVLVGEGTTPVVSVVGAVAGKAFVAGGAVADPSFTTLPIIGGGTNSAAALSGSSIVVSNGSAIVQGAAGTTITVLHGNAGGLPTYGSVVENDISLSNVATDNATTLRHGFLPILPGNPAQFLDGNGNYSIPGAASIAQSYLLTSFSGQTSVNIVHNFGTYPVVQVLTSTSVLVPLTITHNTLNDFTVTFAVSTSGSIIATVGSPQPQALVVISAATYTTLTTDRIIKVTSIGAVITLITSVGNTGREYVIDNASGGDITVNTTSSQTIDNELTQVLHSDNAMSVYSDGANWRIY